jgi:hypothetical protein
VRDFDQSCQETTDCYPVRDGNQCECGLCPNAAINRAAVGDWEEARSAVSGCPTIDCSHSIVCDPMAYACRDNRCVAMTAPNVDARSYDQTCLVNEDCVAIPTGQWCTGCDCNARDAVSNAGYARWAAQVNGLMCTNLDEACNCPHPPPESAVCVFFDGDDTGRCRAGPSNDQAARTSQYAIDYDQGCEVDFDCRLVQQGAMCCMHCADYAAIASSASSTWESDLTLIDCDDSIPTILPCSSSPGRPNGCSRFAPVPACVAGRCEASTE